MEKERRRKTYGGEHVRDGARDLYTEKAGDAEEEAKEAGDQATP